VSDPQRCEGGPAALALVAAWMRLCVCGHVQLEHDIIERGKAAGRRSGCLRTDAEGPCGCTLYEPAPDDPGRQHGYSVLQ